jgi:O-antigen ligase
VRKQIPSIVLASYLLSCIVFGGSAQSPWTNLGLQLAGIALITWAAIGGVAGQASKRAAVINLLVICALLTVLIQLIPLPPAIWTKLPGRSPIADGLTVLGYELGPFPISEMPYEAVLALFAAIPAISVFAATNRLSPSPHYLAAAIVIGMILAIFLGALQVAGGPGSWGYFYKIHNGGAIGFFANGNHMGTLMIIGIPMAAALIVSAASKRRTSSVLRYCLGLAVFTLVVIGIVLNGSRAAIALSIPIIIASISLFPAAGRWRGPALGISVFALVAGVAIVMSNPIATAEFTPGKAAGVGARGNIWSKTLDAIADNFPVGTGLGSFENVYHRYEDPDGVTSSYVNHAHNDYLEIALELGAGGVLLVGLFFVWWVCTTMQIWLSAYSSPFDRAATIATAAILAHSFVDYPLRTGAISAIFAACIGLMARHSRSVSAANFHEIRPTRHVKLG